MHPLKPSFCTFIFSFSSREKRLALKSELQIRKKAMVNEEFPSKEVIDEFMQEPIDMAALQLGWFQPNLVKFVVSEKRTMLQSIFF